MNERRWTLAQVNAFDCAGFVRVIGPVFEHSPWIAEAAWPRRPFASLEELHRALRDVVAEAGELKQVELIRAHPDLVGRAALAGTLTSASAHEQAGAGLDRLDEEEVALFQKHNREYQGKFGFPFVICARLNTKEAMLAAFPVRLQNSRAQEVRAALDEIGKIARLRLEDLFQS
jgi:2-oxo-4-hydroxy-4-carboxy-5-ureidoimidazoline decarboxylase